MGGIVAVGGGREPEEKTMVVAVSAAAGEGEGERSAVVTTDGPEGGGGYKRKGGGEGGPSREPEVGDGRGENPLAVVEGFRRLSPCRLGKTKRSGENPSPSGGHRRRDQWTCAGVPRHHGDLLATSRNKMATLPPSVSERWRQNHVVHPGLMFDGDLFPVAGNNRDVLRRSCRCDEEGLPA